MAAGRLLTLATAPDPWLGGTDFTPWLFAVALSPDRSKAAAGGNLVGVVRVWEVETGHLLWAQAAGEGMVGAVAIDAAGLVLASGHTSGRVRLWDLATGAPLFTLEGHRAHVRTAAFSPGGRILATGGGDTDCKVCLWDAVTGRLLRSFEAHRGVSAVAFSPDGRTLASGGSDQWVRLWDPETGEGVARFRCDGPVRGLWFDPSAPWLFVADGVRRRPPDVCRLEIVGRWS
jgi:WD40 repeat protein